VAANAFSLLGAARLPAALNADQQANSQCHTQAVKDLLCIVHPFSARC
jgi:hypothetical protein